MGLSFTKLLLLAVLGLAVWYGYKYRSRIEAVRRAFAEERAKGHQPSPPPPPKIAAVDLVPCERCGAYVAAHGARPCGRVDCPWRG